MHYRPYSIVTPAFDPTSGGIRVMWGLYGWLLAKGQIVFINGKYDTPHFVAVYPEIYHGNQAGANTVVRYILQTPGVMSMYGVPGPTTFPPEDQIFVFSKIYDTFNVDDDHLLFLPIINLQIFKNRNKKERKKTCFLVGKGVNQNKHPKDSIRLTRNFARDQKGLADVLNECHTLYGYDRLSAMYEIARLCGCRVRYYGGFTKKELELYEPGTDGIIFRDEKTSPKWNDIRFQAHYRGLVFSFSKKLDRFIELTQK